MRVITRWLRRSDERGVALPLVIGIGAVLLILVATGLSVAMTSAKKAVTDEDWNAASAAAYAGIADYQSRLVNDNTYYKFGNPAAPFSATSTGTLKLPTGDLENPAFGLGAGGQWAPVSGASGDASYRYEVDNSQYQGKGVLRVRATGRSGEATRSVIAILRQKGFIDFLYFTMYETQDPAITGTDPVLCTQPYPARPEGTGKNQCGSAIQFNSAEVVNGPLHSNDALYICGGTFKGKVTSSYKTAPYYRNCGTANFEAGVPSYDEPLEMPPTNNSLRNETRADLDEVPRPGCLYTGPTTITFLGNGKMTVRSPWTKYTNIKASGPGVHNPLCGNPGNGANGLGSATGATINVLEQNLVFVQTIPNISGDANYWAPSAKPTGFVVPAVGNGLGYPLEERSGSEGKVSAGESVTNSPQGSAYYDPRAGDVFVKGVVDAQMTIAAENYVWVVNDLVYKDRAAHILGLIGQNAVWVWNPVGRTCKTNNSDAGKTCKQWNTSEFTMLSDSNRRIDAAILSVQHTFQVQNHDRGSTRGNLEVYGAIAQKFRGTVGTSSGSTAKTGYRKMYTYDLRLLNIAPPKFLSPVSTTYGTSQFAETAAAFRADGSAVPTP